MPIFRIFKRGDRGGGRGRTSGILDVSDDAGLEAAEEKRRERLSLLLQRNYSIADSYPIEEPWVRVFILRHKETGEYHYYVDEVELTREEERAFKRIQEILHWELKPPEREKLLEMISVGRASSIQEAEREYLVDQIRGIVEKYRIRFGGLHARDVSWGKILYYTLRDVIGYGKIDPLMKDENIEDISCDGVGSPIYVWHRTRENMRTNIIFTSEEELDSMILRLAHRAGKHISVAFPIVDAILPEGHRLAATFRREVSTRGSTFTIRKFRAEPLSIIDVISQGSIDEALGAYFWLLIDYNMPGMIMGVTGAGKSVSGDTRILALVGGEPGVYTIESLWSLLESRGAAKVRVGGVEAIPNPGIAVRALNPATMEVEWVRPRLMIRHPNDKRIYRVATRSGRYIDVTEDHSLIIVDGGRLRLARPTEDIKGKRVVIPLLGEPQGGPSYGWRPPEEPRYEPPLPRWWWRAPKEWKRRYLERLAQEYSGEIPVDGLGEEGVWELVYALSLAGIPAEVDGSSVRAPVDLPAALNGGSLVLDEITGVYPSRAGVYVYDLDVHPYQSFEANNIIVHNTTMLNILATLIRPNMKVVTIEDTPEIRIPHENWVQLTSRPSYAFTTERVGEIGLFDLVKVSLRYRPDIIIVGEVRGEEAYVLFQAIATGHGGLTTIHAEDIDSMVKRLTSPPMNVPESYIPLLKFALTVRRARIYDGGSMKLVRRVTNVWEIIDYGKYVEVSRWDPKTDSHDLRLDSSVRLKEIAELSGMSMSEVMEELRDRMMVLEWLKKTGRHRYDEIARYVIMYYQSKERLIDLVARES